MRTVQQKKSHHIAIVEHDDGNVENRTTLYPEMCVSRCLAKELEHWLPVALEWNPKQRGHVFQKQENNDASVRKCDTLPPINILTIFDSLTNSLAKKILTIFSLYTYEELSCEISEGTSMEELSKWIEACTNIPAAKQRLIPSISNTNIDDVLKIAKPIQLYIDNYFDKPMAFVCKVDGTMKGEIKPELPELTKTLLENKQTNFKWHTFRRLTNTAYYFVNREERQYKLSLEGYTNLNLLVNHEIEIYESEINRLMKLLNTLDGSTKMFDSTFNHSVRKLKSEVYTFNNYYPLSGFQN